MAESLADPDLTDLIVQASDAFTPSQAELASEVGVQPLALTTWRRGRSRPTRQHLNNMAHALKNRAERLAALAERLQERAAAQEPLTRRRSRGTSRPGDLALARRFADRMANGGPGEVLRVVFYGSRARGNPASTNSDFDFVVVLEELPADLESIERQLRDAATAGLDRPVPTLDIWVCGLDEWNRARALPGHPLRTAHMEGVVLYECA
ncbi:MAG TPA: nucleotidyltransferase domain-containing protein [Longimicrobium sp.]|jgi:transcriptional regulator with XRE-family HTH domain